MSQMAIANVSMISFLFCLTWLDTVAKQKPQRQAGISLRNTINIFSRCSGVGLLNINIIWKPLTGMGLSSLYMYKIFFCNPFRHKSCGGFIQQGPYELGCVLNSTTPSQRIELQCNIGPSLAFHFPRESSFYFIVEATNSSGVYTSTKKTCRLATNLKCTTPQSLSVSALGSRNLTLSWKSPPFMGEITPNLCYKVVYSVAGGANKSVRVDLSDGSLSMTMRDLHSFKNYTFFIQCSLPGCTGWGHPAGPVSVLTDEEAPSKPPIFENWSAVAVYKDKRDVMVIWQPPPRDSWNGIPRKFEIDFWGVSAVEPESLEPNSSQPVRIDDGFATEAALVGLDRFTNYMARVSMCNSKGCGPRSYPLHVQAEENTTKMTRPLQSQRSSGAVPRYVWTVLIIFLLTLPISMMTCIVCTYRKTRRYRNNRQPLEERIQLERPHVYHEDTTPAAGSSNSYDELQLHVGNSDLSPQRPTPDHLQRNSNNSF